MNDTCAETGIDILSEGEVPPSSGSGPIKSVGLMILQQSGVNPYKWHFDFSKKYGTTGIICYGVGGNNNIDNDLITLYSSWVFYPGDSDVLLATGQEGIIHEDLAKG
ncbi:hypothetical protein [Raoultella terrigena]|uniref:hypothetical protein n=1 Tax=Raoultella terrigena TaxID=577 RepID=UPI003850241C